MTELPVRIVTLPADTAQDVLDQLNTLNPDVQYERNTDDVVPDVDPTGSTSAAPEVVTPVPAGTVAAPEVDDGSTGNMSSVPPVPAVDATPVATIPDSAEIGAAPTFAPVAKFEAKVTDAVDATEADVNAAVARGAAGIPASIDTDTAQLVREIHAKISNVEAFFNEFASKVGENPLLSKLLGL
jgi:hypothetical protein